MFQMFCSAASLLLVIFVVQIIGEYLRSLQPRLENYLRYKRQLIVKNARFYTAAHYMPSRKPEEQTKWIATPSRAAAHESQPVRTPGRRHSRRSAITRRADVIAARSSERFAEAA
jgi:hypothetical protein